ncbi:MAG: Preprotein translocase subunit SecB, partial [Lachnospiraceae bacterium]|nr:Preprotein translocase subunit SecB [Lachnospiraceae bacterium]
LGFFSFDTEEELSEDLKMKLINKNTVSIMMPYLRSEVSLLTAQPGMDCVVLPIFNVNNMMEDKEKM